MNENLIELQNLYAMQRACDFYKSRHIPADEEDTEKLEQQQALKILRADIEADIKSTLRKLADEL